MKIAIMSGRAEDGTILPRKEKYVWKEICRVLEEEFKKPIFQEATLLIPIYSKFDLQVLYFAEKQGIPVEYYVPSEKWGLSHLPQHQVKLVERVKAVRHINSSHSGRIVDMLKDADMVYVLTGSAGLLNFAPHFLGKSILAFPQNQMRYHTEEEGAAFHENVANNTRIHTSLKKMQESLDTQISEETSAFLKDIKKQNPKKSLDELLSSYQQPSDQQIQDFLKDQWKEDFWNEDLL